MKRKYCLLVNELSNSGKARSVIEQYKHEIESILEDVEINFIKKGVSLSEITQSKSENFQSIIACGGDGTARSVAIALKGSDTKFGLLPLGSGNDFAKALGLSKSFIQNLETIKRQKITQVDVIRFNEQYFINTLGIGFDGLTNYLASKSSIQSDLKYVVAGFKALTLAKPFSVQITSGERTMNLEVMMVIVANGSWEGGKYFISPESKNNDGISELILVKKISKLRLLIEFIRLSLGSTFSPDIILKQSFIKCTIKASSDQYIHADGELIDNNSSFVVSVEKEKILALI